MLTERVPGSPRTLYYDNENRPVAVNLGAVQNKFEYGPDGERTKTYHYAAGHVSWFAGITVTAELR